jgi:intracellular sulfur oxidation DsrE/DsrF family protein
LNGLIFAALFAAATPQSPAVPEASGYVHLEGAPFTPTKDDTYKAVFNATQGAAQPGDLLPALDNAASEVNALAVEGVPLSRAQFAIVFHGGALDGILDDAHYRAKYGVANPNVAVLRKLKEQGTELYVCGQNLVAAHVDPKTLTPEVTVASDALLVLISLQQKGYAVLEF